MNTEDEFETELAIVAREVAEARLQLKLTKRAAVDAETVFIGAKLKQERLQESFRMFKNQRVRPSEDKILQDAESDRFNEALPELLKKI